MKRHFSIYNNILNYIVLIVLLFTGVSCNRSDEERSKILKIYNWGDYIDEDLLIEFPKWYKEQTGEEVEIIYQTFDINEVMLTKIERGHEDFDVVCPSEYIIERMMRKNMLLPIQRNFGKTPDYIHNLAPFIKKELNKMSPDERIFTDYAVCYMWGTAGILYNSKYIPSEEAKSWECLWNKKYPNKVLMKDSYRDAYGTAIIYANREAIKNGETSVENLLNDNSEEAIALAEKYLKELKPNIAGWEADFGKELMTKGKGWMNLTWSGDAVWSIEEAKGVGVDLHYEVPIEGSNIWFDGWVIPKYARNIKAASYFINYLCRPDIALRNMDAIGYVSAIGTPEIMAAKIDTTIHQYSDLSYFFGPEADSIQINPIQYPDRKVVERCSVIRDFKNKEDLGKILEMWSRVKGDNLNTGIVILIFVVFGILFIVLAKNKIQKIRRKRRNKKKRRK